MWQRRDCRNHLARPDLTPAALCWLADSWLSVDRVVADRWTGFNRWCDRSYEVVVPWPCSQREVVSPGTLVRDESQLVDPGMWQRMLVGGSIVLLVMVMVVRCHEAL